MRRLLIAPLFALALAAGLALGLLPQHDSMAAPAAVNIQNFAFGPASVAVNAGESVTWTNSDSVPHTATSDPGVSPAFNTGNIAPGGSASVTFNTAGTFTYFCQVHPNMKGTVVVTAASGGGATTTPATSGTSTTGGTAPSAPASGSGYGSGSSGSAGLVVAGGVVLAAGVAGFVALRRMR